MVGYGIRLPIPHIFTVIKVNLYITFKAGSFALEQKKLFRVYFGVSKEEEISKTKKIARAL